MRYVHLFIVGYLVLVLGLVLALWQTGMLTQVAPVWFGVGTLVIVGAGIMLAVVFGKPTTAPATAPTTATTRQP